MIDNRVGTPYKVIEYRFVVYRLLQMMKRRREHLMIGAAAQKLITTTMRTLLQEHLLWYRKFTRSDGMYLYTENRLLLVFMRGCVIIERKMLLKKKYLNNNFDSIVNQ
jgi:hypothetical protein